MKIAVVSRNLEKLRKHAQTLQPYKKYMSTEPDIVVALGGDGSFLAAERYYPGIPKLLVRENSICNKCGWEDLGDGLLRIVNRKYTTEDVPKLTVSIREKKLEGVNDIVVRNTHPTHAIRFTLQINNKKLSEEFIGDGIVVATVFGSGGYFHSITNEHIESGVGLAFNNTTKNHDPLFLPEDVAISLTITRGRAHVVADNNPVMLVAEKKDNIIIRKSVNVARLVKFE